MPGTGQGGGRGYELRRNTIENVGLYGGLPGMGESESSGSFSNSRPGTARAPRTGGSEPAHPAATGSNEHRSGAGTEGAIPPLYRRRVADYFQRIADETGGK